MATLEERVAFLEGKVEEHSRGIDGIREAVVHLEQRMDRRFEAVDRRLEAVDRRLEALDQKLTRQFVWFVGVQVTTLAAIVVALVGR